MPALTEERRKELARHVAHEGENAKIAVRNVRRDALQQIKDLLKEKLITEDADHRVDDEVQKLTDRAIKDIDAVVKAKEDELMAL
jgi:ribosome recycling factor